MSLLPDSFSLFILTGVSWHRLSSCHNTLIWSLEAWPSSLARLWGERSSNWSFQSLQTKVVRAMKKIRFISSFSVTFSALNVSSCNAIPIICLKLKGTCQKSSRYSLLIFFLMLIDYYKTYSYPSGISRSQGHPLLFTQNFWPSMSLPLPNPWEVLSPYLRFCYMFLNKLFLGLQTLTLPVRHLVLCFSELDCYHLQAGTWSSLGHIVYIW